MGGPTTSKVGAGFSVSCTGESAAAPTMLFATPTDTSNTSPGATISGRFGEITKSPRTSARVDAVPTALSLTATAITRSVPAK